MVKTAPYGMYRTAAAIILLLAVSAWAQTDTGASAAGTSAKLIVGTKEAAPFAMKNADGEWSGISIQLWDRIAERLGLAYELRETDLQGLLEGVASGNFDAAVAALTVTPDRERELDFTHPFHTTGLAIAVAAAEKSGWLRVLERVVSVEFLQVLGALVLLLLTVGFLVWVVERKHNREHFGGSPVQGIGAAFYWSAVTMTTVGYGDKVATTLAGRLLTIIWMFAAVIIISSFTAAITSALTVGQLESKVQGPDDLPKVRVGTIAGSTSEAYLHRERIGIHNFNTVADGLSAVAAREIDAMVYDAPILRYLTKTEFSGQVRVLPVTFERQYYAFALTESSKYREPVNRVLLEEIRSQAWRDMLYNYLGAR